MFSNISQAHRSAGRVAESQKAALESVKLYQQLTVDFPNDYRVHRGLAYMYGELGQWNEATEAYLQAAEIDCSGQAVVDTTTKERAELKRDQIHAYGRDWRIGSCAGSMSALIQPAVE